MSVPFFSEKKWSILGESAKEREKKIDIEISVGSVRIIIVDFWPCSQG